jgi:hypothetical protein
VALANQTAKGSRTSTQDQCRLIVMARLAGWPGGKA